jgi:putative CocE/NonD family hydrolase
MLKSAPYPTQGVRLVKNLLVPMRDGVHLAMDLYMPEGAGPGRFPVVLEYIPYRKDNVRPGDPFYDFFPLHGYVMARIDCRGTGASGGRTSDEYMALEQADGHDAIEWIASQPWCDGHVNMIGISYGGFSALQCASLAPPHLTSIIPMDFTDDRYLDDCHYVGGLLRMYYDAGFYGCFMVAWNAMPPSAEWLDADWAAIWEAHLEGDQPYLLEWFRHQTDGPYWRNGSVGDIAERIRCPVFMIGGWRDGYCNPPFRLCNKLQVPRKMLLGPWNHNKPDSGMPGPRIDYLSTVLRWLDHWCKGINTGLMDEPPIVVYMQKYDRPDPRRRESSGLWRAETQWPPPKAAERIFYLDGGTLAGEPRAAGVDSFEYLPSVGTTGGLWSAGVPFGLPGDQRPDEALSLVYDSAPLLEDLAILGQPLTVLHLASSARVMGFVVRLCEVGPDGSSHLIAKGILNATRRDSFTDPAPLVPDEVFRLEVPIDATGWIFTKGNRIRLSISSADFPNVWPTPERGVNRVFRGPQQPSHIALPVVPIEGSAKPPQFAPAAPKAEDGLPLPRWEIVEEVLSGQTQLRYEIPRLGGSIVAEACVDRHNPANASVAGKAIIEAPFANGMIRSVSETVVQSTATHFHIIVDLKVTVNDTTHFLRRWTESVARLLL